MGRFASAFSTAKTIYPDRENFTCDWRDHLEQQAESRFEFDPGSNPGNSLHPRSFPFIRLSRVLAAAGLCQQKEVLCQFSPCNLSLRDDLTLANFDFNKN
ncbi:MAG: hypothetical protein EAZ60_09285 [Oscillatoriales cyanobacterium]|nr:MAG: hypothetical protein EAZ83_01140 [Oscillatoriales cyanobacterium]TAE94462.1 MAG: hypothetical protein EAZ79_23205 [Oscillatoriales cyanobacterium]TAF24026.1 MAG: hypothetical protein EAZ73_00175 [Oscillatoriales cyanobacterium]TAF38605.1 MAG: hypothetical protein EAZ69_04165 [Oscillatoriales cyanobacterium]TAF56577.1 MAG: hypothetical protein EAZ60_09285 [Oscillatoriales cyanobacterium]